jgi:hypothetical protein
LIYPNLDARFARATGSLTNVDDDKSNEHGAEINNDDEEGAPSMLARAAFQACKCAMELNERCREYKVAEVQAVLKIHCGIGAGRVHAFRVVRPVIIRPPSPLIVRASSAS